MTPSVAPLQTIIMKLINTSVAAIAALTLATSTGISSAATIAYDVDTVLTGATPTSTSPWLTVTLVDVSNRATDPLAVADYVRITLTSNLVADEFFSKVYLEIHPKFASASLALPGLNTGVGLFEDPTITVGANEFNVGGGFGALIPRGGWNPAEAHVELNFTTSNQGGLPGGPQGIRRFNNTDSYSFTIGYDGPESMVAENLQLLYAQDDPEYYAAAHIQGIVNGQSSWGTSVPEPSTALLGAFGLLGLVGRRKR